MQPVVVGLDGSASAAAAVEFAAAEATALGVPLRIVHGYVWPLLYACLANVPYRPGDWEPAESAVKMVEAVGRRLRTAHPELVVQTAVASGSGGAVLLEESAHASLVVIGSRGGGGIAGLLSGPVAGYLSGRAHCPVVVVPEGQPPATDGGQVCVGVDGTPSSLAALRFACRWAERRHGSVEAIHVATGHQEIGSRRIVAELDGWIGDADGHVPVRPVIVRGLNPADALAAAGKSARLLVLGARRHGALAAVGIGSVGRVIKRAPCPVVIVPAPEDTSAPELDSGVLAGNRAA